MSLREETHLKIYKKYTAISKLLAEVCDIAVSVDENLDSKDLLKKFDLTLQAILFMQCKSNKTLYPKEKLFIEKLSEGNDIILAVRQRFADDCAIDAESISWDNVFDRDLAIVEKIEQEIRKVTKACVKDIVAYVAIAEYLAKKNFFTKFSEETVDFLWYFAELENGAEDNEVKQGIVAYCQLVADNYINVKNNVEEIFADSKKIEKDVLAQLRKEYKASRKSKRTEFIERHVKSVKRRLAGHFRKDKEDNGED